MCSVVGHVCQMNVVLTTQLSPIVTYRIRPLWCSCTVGPVGGDQPVGFVIFFEINTSHAT